MTIEPRSTLPREKRDDTPDTTMNKPVNIACSTLKTGFLNNHHGAPRNAAAL
jgi:hypothetical protein